MTTHRKGWIAIALCLCALTAHGQFMRLAVKPPSIPKPFYLTLDVDDCNLGLYVVYFDKSHKTNCIGFLGPQSLNISNLYATNTYWFLFNESSCGLWPVISLYQWRPPLTNYATVGLAGLTNSITFTNPPNQFWKLRGTSWTGADLLATDNLHWNLWLKVGSFSYPSNPVPRLTITRSSTWDGIEAYEHAQ